MSKTNKIIETAEEEIFQEQFRFNVEQAKNIIRQKNEFLNQIMLLDEQLKVLAENAG